MALHHSHWETKGPEVGLVQVPVTNPNLCFEIKDTLQDLFHCPKFEPISATNERLQLG